MPAATTVTFVDAGVLIAACRGTVAAADKAYAILDDPHRTFVASQFLQLEVLPKSIYYKHETQVELYEYYFMHVASSVEASTQLVAAAHHEACQHGLSALDALHVAAAKVAGAEEFITTERPTSPLFRVQGIRIVSIYPA